MHNLIENLKTTWREFNWQSFRSINSLKTAIACTIGYIIVLFSPLKQSSWIVVTIIVVMSAQSTIGGLLIKSYMRFWGTLSGAIVSIIILMILSHNHIAIGMVLFIAILFFTYIAGSNKDISAAGQLGSVTTAIILLAKDPSAITALTRFSEIMLGIIIALLVSRFVFPIRARDGLKLSMIKTLSNLKLHYQNCFDKIVKINITVSPAEELIITAFAQQRKLIHEYESEFHRKNNYTADYKDALENQRKIYRSINLMNYCTHVTDSAAELISQLQNLNEFNKQVESLFLALVKLIKEETKINCNTDLQTIFTLLKNESRLLLNDLDYEKTAAVNSFIFSAQYLVTELKNLTLHLEKLYLQQGK